jgi:glutamate-1-semialdehyde 2,1-aminomutase
VITGFRLGISGAQGYFGITPDLTCLGKIIGGGFPVGAFGGKKEIMDLLAPEGGVYQAGTLSGNPVAMIAGIKTLEILLDDNFYFDLNQKTKKFTDSLTEVFRDDGICINSIGSMFTFFFNKGPIENYQDVQKCDFKKFAEFYDFLLGEGIYLSPSQFETNFVSAIHKEEELNNMIKIIKNNYRNMIRTF